MSGRQSHNRVQLRQSVLGLRAWYQYEAAQKVGSRKGRRIEVETAYVYHDYDVDVGLKNPVEAAGLVETNLQG
jgi:hypothetical protein